MRHLLVTNDFPPKLGGIQSYLWELWRRLPPESFVVFTTPYAKADEWDRQAAFRVVRSRQKVLLPTPALIKQVNHLVKEYQVDLVILDPALPVGAIGPYLDVPYGLVLHGAEVTVPGRLPASRALLGRTLRGANRIIAAGGYPAAEAELAAGTKLPITIVPPGVDTQRFVPLGAAERTAARAAFDFTADDFVVLGLSRLVPRKGFDILIEAAARLRLTYPQLVVAIGGSGRDRDRLERLALSSGARTRFLGRVPDDHMPGLYGSADLFVMMCRGDRWAGLEQEGFGIVFLEAAASGVAQIAGRSGGAHEAVANEMSGLVIDDPRDVDGLAQAITTLIEDSEKRLAMGSLARKRAETEFTYDLLAGRLAMALEIDQEEEPVETELPNG